jgi:hypothetical protein
MAYQGRREEAEAVALDEAGDDYGYSDDDVDVPEEEDEEEDTEEYAPQRGGAVGPPKSQRGPAAKGAPKRGEEGTRGANQKPWIAVELMSLHCTDGGWLGLI